MMSEYRVGLDGVSLTSTILAIISPICAMLACIIIICAIIFCCPALEESRSETRLHHSRSETRLESSTPHKQITFHFAISEPS
jgi:hypothetical protein